MGDSSRKLELIPHVVSNLMVGLPKLGLRKDLAHREGFAAYQLVDEVTAHQG